MSDIVLLDGGMGQELLHRSGRPPSPLWSAAVLEEQPELVRELHADFLRAGASVITLNTYSATPERLARYGKEDSFERLQAEAIRLAREAIDTVAGHPASIAGCLPPLVASYRPDLAPDIDTMRKHYRRIVACQSGDVDLFICETMASIDEACIAAECALESTRPVWVALTVSDDEAGVLRSGEPLADAVSEIGRLPVDALLLNCSTPEAIERDWPILAQASGTIGTYANAFTAVDALQPGGTVDVLEARHDLGPARYASWCLERVEAGAGIIGGCCEVGPEFIAALRDALLGAGYGISSRSDSEIDND